jgi:drug/metabolite transporter (DMT)-like permease
MQWYVVGVVLLAACIHAAWNASVKTGTDVELSTALVTTAAACLAAVILPVLPSPAPASWPYILGSVALQFAYYELLVRAYATGDLSHTYPIMRGTAPLIVAALSASLIGETLTAARWAGVALVCAGVLGLAVHRGAQSTSHRAATGYALANAFAIAGYTLVDGLGVRASGQPASYTLWLFLAIGAARLLWTWLRRRRDFVQALRSRWLQGFAGGVGTVSSYGLALWAMTVAPVALVAALRETSILFASVISVLVLKERVTLPRMLCIAVIAAGAATLALTRH